MRGKIKQYEEIPIDRVVAYENNARTHSAEQLVKLADSIKEFGFITPVLIDKNNTIIAGHGRVEAAKMAKLKKIPCVRVDGLTEAQRRAYILADNKITELGGWDKEKLGAELQWLEKVDFNIDLTGFELPNVDDLEMPDDGFYGDERMRTDRAYNLEIAHETEITDDFWQMPVIQNDEFTPSDLIGFNYAKTSKNKKCGIHFFVDDYQFERVWNYPEKYTDVLREYECILSPDFSLYMDMPMPMKIWNVYRSRQIGAYYQQQGIRVIPTISWAEPETYQFCFLGVPEGAVVAVSTVGIKNSDESMSVFADGVKAMIDYIKPSKILVYGGVVDVDYGGTEVVEYENKVTEQWKYSGAI